MKYLSTCLILIFTEIALTCAQSPQTPNFRSVVETRLRERYGVDLKRVCPVDTDPVADRVFRDYGAIFVSNNGGLLPSNCILTSGAAVQAFQTGLQPDVVSIGGVEVTLQKAAMTAFLAARSDAAKKGLRITPRGGASASTRSYSTTVDLWNSRFAPALAYWSKRGLIKPEEKDTAQKAAIRSQVALVLEWEKKGMYFSKDLSKSILYSVAVPGASQHCFMLAIDIDQFADKRVRQILADHGWYQTVKSDLPHFTYIGETEKRLPSLGLTPTVVSGQTFWIPNM